MCVRYMYQIRHTNLWLLCCVGYMPVQAWKIMVYQLLNINIITCVVMFISTLSILDNNAYLRSILLNLLCFLVIHNCLKATDINGTNYDGETKITKNGRVCQAWESNNRFPDLMDESNFCRNPDNHARPWCYTNDPNVDWEYCNVPVCGM